MGRIPLSKEYADHYKSWGRILQNAGLLAAKMASAYWPGDGQTVRLIEGKRVPFQRLIFDPGNMDSAASVRREMYLPTWPLWPSDSLPNGPITPEWQV